MRCLRFHVMERPHIRWKPWRKCTQMNQRRVTQEILDHLPADDPVALHSRSDLRRINHLMGNERWVLRMLEKHPHAVAASVTELGAGDGSLAVKIARRFVDSRVRVHDLTPCPPLPQDVAGRIDWHAGDVFECPPSGGGVLVANLFLHHFEGQALMRLGAICREFDLLVINEPDRSRLALWLGGAMMPFVNHVTRHDMIVSIRAGFLHGELSAMLGLDPASWKWSETSTWRGARRVLAWRT